MKRALFAVYLTLTVSACIDIDFDPPEIIKGPRVLAMSANPPEAIFGEDVYFEALAVDANGDDLTAQPGFTTRWTVCLSLAQIFGGAGLGGSVEVEDNCGEGGDDLLVLPNAGSPDTAFLSGELLVALLSMIGMAPPDPPPPDPAIPGIDPEVLATLVTVIAEVGVPLRATFEVFRDSELIVHGYKRFALTTRSGATLNPPRPRFSIGELELSARGTGDPHECVSVDGTIASVAAGTEVVLAPFPLEEPWLESYPVFDLAGGLIQNHESAYYVWYSTAGAFESAITQRPNRDNVWTAPEEPGTYPLFLVVLDGHLGQVWCRTSVEIR